MLRVPVLICVVVNMAICQVSLDSGLVAYWSFSGNALDESDNQNHGEVFEANLTMDRFDQQDAAYEFNGTSSYISVPNSESIQSPTEEITMLAYVNAYSWSLVGDPFGPILMKSLSSTNSFQYRMAISGNGLAVAFNDWNNVVLAPVDFEFETWYQVAATFKSDTVKFYVDGSMVMAQFFDTTIDVDDNELVIGRDEPGITEVFNGKIDDVRIYNRALTAAEIKADFITNISEEDLNSLPQTLVLFQNYPNPFNPTTVIRLQSAVATEVELTVYDFNGRLVRQLLDGQQLVANKYKVSWDGTNQIGQRVASGVYIYRVVTSSGLVQSRKMILMR